jgi:hypothetical protein
MNPRQARLCRVTVQRKSYPQQHAKLCAFDPEACVNMHEVHGGTTQGFLRKTSHPRQPLFCLPSAPHLSLLHLTPSRRHRCSRQHKVVSSILRITACPHSSLLQFFQPLTSGTINNLCSAAVHAIILCRSIRHHD